MSKYLIVVTGIIYTYVAIEQFFTGNRGLGLAYAGYAFSTIGLFKMAV